MFVVEQIYIEIALRPAQRAASLQQIMAQMFSPHQRSIPYRLKRFQALVPASQNRRLAHLRHNRFELARGFVLEGWADDSQRNQYAQPKCCYLCPKLQFVKCEYRAAGW